MSLTSGKQKTAAAGAVTASLVGTALIANGLHHQLPAHALAGVAACMVGLTLVILITVRRWITATGAERARLAADQAAAQEEKATYLAAKAALENEQQRLHRDLTAERVALAKRVKVEREAMRREFEENRAQLVSETMEATFRMIHEGKFAPEERKRSTVIAFPRQHPEAEQERTRERGHGVVGP